MLQEQGRVKVFRYEVFNVTALCLLAGKLLEGQACFCGRWQIPTSGSLNWSIRVPFSDGIEWVLHSPREDGAIQFRQDKSGPFVERSYHPQVHQGLHRHSSARCVCV